MNGCLETIQDWIEADPFIDRPAGILLKPGKKTFFIVVVKGIDNFIGETHKAVDRIDGIAKFFSQASYAQGERGAVQVRGEPAAADRDIVKNFFHTPWDTEPDGV